MTRTLEKVLNESRRTDDKKGIIRKKKQVFHSRLQREQEWCYCYRCKYEVLCASWDLPETKKGPLLFKPLDDESDSE